MKILFIENNNITFCSFRKELLDELIGEGYEICLVGDLSESTIKAYEKKVSIIKIKTNLKTKNIFSNYGLIRKYKKIIKTFKPDILLSFTIKPNIYANFYKHNYISIANITGLGSGFNKNGLLKKIIVKLYKRSFKNVNHVMFQNHNGLEQFQKLNIAVNNYSIIPGSGINEDRFLLQELDNHQGINFLFPSRPIEKKGFYLLLKAIPEVLKEYPDCRFTFLGKIDNKAEKAIKSAQEKHNLNSEFISFVDNVEYYYKKADFIVSPSFYNEGISNVLLEALACGRPIITTNDNPGCMEVLQEGINGYGVKSNDLDSLIVALLKAANTPKDKIVEMGKSGREFVIKNFNRKETINIYLDIIKKSIL